MLVLVLVNKPGVNRRFWRPIKVDTREKSPVPAGRAGLLPVVYQSFTSRLLSRLLSRLPSRLLRVYGGI